MKFHRRNCISLMVPAEIAIRNAISTIEEMGCNIVLTEAINLLHQASEKVSAFADASIYYPPVEGPSQPDLSLEEKP